MPFCIEMQAKNWNDADLDIERHVYTSDVQETIEDAIMHMWQLQANTLPENRCNAFILDLDLIDEDGETGAIIYHESYEPAEDLADRGKWQYNGAYYDPRVHTAMLMFGPIGN